MEPIQIFVVSIAVLIASSTGAADYEVGSIPRQMSWTLDDAITEILKLRQELLATQNNLANTMEMLQATHQNLQRTELDLRLEIKTVSSRVVPVGSIYIGYYGQPSPASLWPDLKWEDITSTYAGLFFRAAGGDAATWGVIQQECAPRITQMEYLGHVTNISKWEHPLDIPGDGWSEGGLSGQVYYYGPQHYQGIRFHTEGCEIRPRNQAIRIWRRSG